MLLNAEIKEDNYVDLPRQETPQMAQPASQFLKADVSTGQHYIDLNAAATAYSGPWLFGKQHIVVPTPGGTGSWDQSLPVPAGIADGVLIKGNVIYSNGDGTYRMSPDRFQGVIRTEGSWRVFEGSTEHTFDDGVHVVADLNIPFSQILPYNPLIVVPPRNAPPPQQMAAQTTYAPPSAPNAPADQQDPDAGF